MNEIMEMATAVEGVVVTTSMDEIRAENMTTALVEQIRSAKHAEVEARNRRVAAEEELIKLIGFDKENGSTTINVGDSLKVTLTAKVNHRLDAKKWDKIKGSIPLNMQPVTYKPSLITEAVNYLINNEPDAWSRIAQAVTSTPAKVAVTVKVL
jgi:hypothetical protein